MSVRTLVAVAAMLIGASAGHAYAQAGSGASTPSTVTAPTTSSDSARTPALGDASQKPSTRRPRTRPIPSSQNGNTPDRASAAGGAR